MCSSEPAIRLVAATGSELHLIGPLGFDLSDAKLRRAGLDYHDLASVIVHPDLASAWASWAGSAGGQVCGRASCSAPGTARFCPRCVQGCTLATVPGSTTTRQRCSR